jgi:ribonucleotide monophosphatase NagD (HAD superfamily)
MTQKSLFAPIAARFGFVFIDQYGVLHDGQTPLSRRDRSARDIEGARSARRHSLQFRPIAAYNARRLADLGIAEDLYDHFVTSGDVAKRALQDGKIGFTVGRGARCMTVSGSSSHDLVDTLGLVSTDDGDAAELLIISGSASLSVRVGRIACFAVSRHLEGWKKQHYQLDRRSNRSLESIGKMQVGASR